MVMTFARVTSNAPAWLEDEYVAVLTNLQGSFRSFLSCSHPDLAGHWWSPPEPTHQRHLNDIWPLHACLITRVSRHLSYSPEMKGVAAGSLLSAAVA